MTKIRIEIDTDSEHHEMSRSAAPATAASVLVVSPITMRKALASTLEGSFTDGLNSTGCNATVAGIKDKLGFSRKNFSKIQQVIRTFSNVKVIVTAGGA